MRRKSTLFAKIIRDVEIFFTITICISLQQINYLKLQVQAVTQSLKLCYASCHAKLFDKAKACHQNRLESVARSVKKLCDKAKNKVSGCGAVGSALPWGGRGRKFKRRWQRQRKSHQTKIGGSTEPPIFFYFFAKSLEFSRFRNKYNRLVLPCF